MSIRFNRPFFRLEQALYKILVVMLFTYCLPPGVLHAQQKQRLYDDLFSASFPNEKEGWACGRWGCILRTEDGGKTWSRQDSGTDYTLTSIHFVDPNNGWAVGDGGTIVHTKNGGKTWEKQQSPIPFYLMRVYFATPSKGWIVTEQTHILSTGDGGKNWIVQFKDQDFILKSISFSDPFNGWAVGEYGYIYRTTNGGATWKKQSGYFKLSDRTGDVEGGTFLFDVVSIDPQTAWAVGIDGYVIKTTDGGKTWKEVVTGAQKTQLFCIATDKKDTIFIGGKSTFLSSVDKGKTWKTPEFKPPIIYNWIYGLASRGRSGFIAVGGDGAIYLNVSTSWQRVVY
jgi:photosystem II stability/assembly factor-like uncharacterized protein